MHTAIGFYAVADETYFIITVQVEVVATDPASDR